MNFKNPPAAVQKNWTRNRKQVRSTQAEQELPMETPWVRERSYACKLSSDDFPRSSVRVRAAGGTLEPVGAPLISSGRIEYAYDDALLSVCFLSTDLEASQQLIDDWAVPALSSK